MANRKFDVFLSFRGPDTRKTLVDHLYYRLTAAQLNVFLDKETLERGNHINLSLEQAIQNSRIVIPIFSKNYAYSVWCLNEVVMMVESKNIMIPIFYDVEPQQVRHQKGPFAQAFQQHKDSLGYSEDTVQKWCRALYEACSFSGWSLPDDFHGYEGKLVDIVTSQILRKLQTTRQLPKFSVGLEERVAKVITLLQMESDEKLIIVGIYGIGGTGKTTLATAVFNSMCFNFSVSYFLSDVRNTEHTELRRKIVNNMVYKINNSAEGDSWMGKDSISITNALLVLDDVDDRDVLDELLEQWFHLQGRVIVTSRDTNVLGRKHNHIPYHVDELNYDQALKLFCRHAFSQEFPSKNYPDLTEKVVKACQGLPLTIEVIARLLYDKKDSKIWIEVLKQLENGEITKMEERLIISYDNLNETEKQIFLDIACFFIGSEKSKVLSIWESSGWSANLAIHNLHAKSLVKFTFDDRLQMHDILRDMGRAIVRKQNHADPGKRSRLWDEKEVRKALKDHLVSRSVQGIIYDSHKWKVWSAEDFEPMQNLRLLSVSNTIIGGDFRKLTSQLIWLRWKCCSLDCLPVELKMKKMAVLELPQSSIKQVWDDQFHQKAPKNLKVLNLSECSQLEKLPDFLKLRFLVKLELHGCMRITTLPESIGSLEKLEYMDLSNCQNLKELPHSFSGLVSLKKLNLSHCTSLTMLPDNLGNLTSMRELLLISTSISEMPDFFAGMFLLEKLSISNSTALKRLPSSLGTLHRLRILDMDSSGFVCLPEEIGKLRHLEELNLSLCCNLLQLPESFGNFENLRILKLNGIYNLMRLPGNLSGLRALQVLEASSCGLKMLPVQFASLMSLEAVHLEYNNFCMLPVKIKYLPKLTKLILRGCEELLELPRLPGSLVHVDVSNCKRLSRVSDISNMKCLETLLLHNCEELECVPGLGSLQALVDLNITGCKSLKSTDITGLDSLKSLGRLHLGGTGVIVSKLQNWAKGRELIFYGNEIPEWLDHQIQNKMDKCTSSNLPLMDIHISMDQNMRCVGVIFCFISYEKHSGIDATVIRGGFEVLRIQIVRNRGEDSSENGRDELHLFICSEKHDFVRSLQDGDRICIWAHPSHPHPRIWGKKGGVHLLCRREGKEKQVLEEEKNLYNKLFLDLAWMQWSWIAWKHLPIDFGMHLLAAYDLAGSFINRKIWTYSMSLASQTWGRSFSQDAVHMVIEKAGMRWNLEECFELETVLVQRTEETADGTTINLNPKLLVWRNSEAIGGATGGTRTSEVDIYVGNRWLEWRRLLADGRSELLIELGVRTIKRSTTDVHNHNSKLVAMAGRNGSLRTNLAGRMVLCEQAWLLEMALCGQAWLDGIAHCRLAWLIKRVLCE
ncbi:hypothetical protein SUGI_0961550 [Cryptomeria japonica]|nr:hypothetical protein SUGI_0961550 [Cryptomeria japonica]